MMEASHATQWDDLPPDMMELILCRFSWDQLAPISSVSRAFRAAYRKQLAVEQKARCNLANATFGDKQISCIAGIINRYFRGERLHPDFRLRSYPHDFDILEDGTVGAFNNWVERRSSHTAVAWVKTCYIPRGMSVHPVKVVLRIPPNGVHVCTLQLSGDRHGAVISVMPESDGDVLGVGLIQALLSVGPTPLFGGAGPHAHIRVVRKSSNGNTTKAGLRRQLAPLLPFASKYYRPTSSEGFRDVVEQRITLGQAGVTRKVKLVCSGRDPFIIDKW
jgi:hypothetical protein